MHLHHKKPRCLGGSDDPENLVLLDPLEHAEIHALDFIEGGPMFDFRHEGWPLLDERLRRKILQEASRRRSHKNKTEAPSGYTRSSENRAKISAALRAQGIKPPGTLGLKKSDKERQEIGERSRKVMLGRRLFNNGEIQVFRHECPPGFTPGGLPRAK